ncbi:cysteine--tRNA ligase [Jatrophihabitans lederbergiae]|uniref:Cysteine--tRNA ligase n=1 Tax=Jatrophihabitans lederbergiae TaxID=3075547 RepID=A0ABU2J7C9_9ACTN|nr:cysteine--tRNA ligase [Jatrophihabitans sp. DSM 44399]MDT0260894.1 cysteine--tRNA ligase [Jatrophihabitans sp. DSM 44399]
MTLRLYDTATRTVRDFVPLEPGRASIYLCGATVQGAPHIGHLRSGLNFDILRRWLTVGGYDVVLIRNVTDIDDKIIAKAAAAGRPWWAHAALFEQAFRDGYQTLGCLPPTAEPRATGHIPEMITLMRRLIDSGHAYAADGDVYFDVRSFPGYGSLSGQRIDGMLPAGDSVGEDRKRDARDFALWKAAKVGEPSWPTPWGDGRPGWHLECSAMAGKYLGPSFDIHGGGLDLIFPHHENELAQSVAAGDEFARYWMHNGWVTMAGEKMSKSLGNTVLVSEMAQQWRPVELRYYLGAAHYRSAIEYSPEALKEAAVAYGKIEQFVNRAIELVGAPAATGPLPAEFVQAMDDDLGVPQALAVLHNTRRAGNTGLTSGDKAAVAQALQSVLDMTSALGLNPLDWASTSGTASALTATVDQLVRLALEQRQAARQRKDYAASDAIRDALAEAGISVEDTPEGSRWTLAPRS